jgi:aminoglycoside phosphotransferase (APT) family kinase protein
VLVDLVELRLKLTEWLVDRHGFGERIENVELLSGGFSQLMVSFDLHGPNGAQRLVLRASRPAAQSITATDRSAEWEIVSSLSRRGDVSLPGALWFDHGPALGVPCFVVEYVEGATVSKLFAADPGRDRRAVADRLCDCLVSIHSVPLEDLPAQLARPSSWDDHIDALIDRWRSLERTGLEPDPIARYLANWLEAHKPAPAPLCLVHGEVNNDNLIVTGDGGVTAVDWEYAHVGDPREDFGWYRTVSASVPPDVLADDIEAVCARYREATGLGEDVINPAAIGYFGLLAGASVYSTFVGAPAAVEQTPDAPVLAAYMSAVLAQAQLMWMAAMESLEPVLPDTSLDHK